MINFPGRKTTAVFCPPTLGKSTFVRDFRSEVSCVDLDAGWTESILGVDDEHRSSVPDSKVVHEVYYGLLLGLHHFTSIEYVFLNSLSTLRHLQQSPVRNLDVLVLLPNYGKTEALRRVSGRGDDLDFRDRVDRNWDSWMEDWANEAQAFRHAYVPTVTDFFLKEIEALCSKYTVHWRNL